MCVCEREKDKEVFARDGEGGEVDSRNRSRRLGALVDLDLLAIVTKF